MGDALDQLTDDTPRLWWTHEHNSETKQNGGQASVHCHVLRNPRLVEQANSVWAYQAT